MKILEEYIGTTPIVIIKHNTMGHLCGYAGVAKAHPWFGIEYHQCLEGCKGEINNTFSHPFTHWLCGHPTPERIIEVHGGLTYSGLGDGKFLPEDYWWFGFDCSHAWDIVPGLGYHNFGDSKATYKDKDYVLKELKSLVTQLARAQEK